MKIQMVRDTDDYWNPELLCDQCGLSIQNPELAIVIWIDPQGWTAGKSGDRALPKIVHKGHCDYMASIGSKLQHRPWSELTTILERLRTPVPQSTNIRLSRSISND
jgi:hypothetical protein